MVDRDNLSLILWESLFSLRRWVFALGVLKARPTHATDKLRGYA